MMSNVKVIVSKSRLLAANNVIKNMASSLNGVAPVVAKTGNEKRIESCKKVGGAKKRVGHKREKDFLKKYNPADFDKPIEYGATADTTICPTHPICDILREKINHSNLFVSNKSGNNIQFTLGQIPELKDINVDTLNSDKELVRDIFNKYLKKIESATPAGILVYKDTANEKWVFFNMDDVVNYIVEKCTWRMLDSGRIKGDFADNSNKGVRQYITYEYRRTHKSYFLGLNGGKGIEFIKLLMEPDIGISHYVDTY